MTYITYATTIFHMMTIYDFLEETGLSLYRLHKVLGVPYPTIRQRAEADWMIECVDGVTKMVSSHDGKIDIREVDINES